MALPTFTIRGLLEAGIHFGHHPRRWNPKMAPYLFGVRNNVHIINLEQTVPMLYSALEATRDIVSEGGRVLFVGTKPQASEIVADFATRCGQYYVNHRWLGGMLTNWNTVSQSIKRLQEYNEELEKGEEGGLTKKELLRLTRQRNKLELSIGGIKEIGGVPDLLFVIDTNREMTAVREAIKLEIPIVGVVDSNCDPTIITYPIPGNDDAIRAISLYCELMSGAILEGIQTQMVATGVDMGEATEVPDAETTAPETTEDAEKKKVTKKAKPEEVEAPKKAEKPKVEVVKKAPKKIIKKPVGKEEVKPVEKITKAKAPKATESTVKKATTAKAAPAKKKTATTTSVKKTTATATKKAATTKKVPAKKKKPETAKKED